MGRGGRPQLGRSDLGFSEKGGSPLAIQIDDLPDPGDVGLGCPHNARRPLVGLGHEGDGQFTVEIGFG